VVDQAVEEAKQSPVPVAKDLWTDIYYKDTEPPSMRGREREEVRVASSFWSLFPLQRTLSVTGAPLLSIIQWPVRRYRVGMMQV